MRRRSDGKPNLEGGGDNMKKINILMVTEGLSKEESRRLYETILKINAKRRRANMQRLRYKVKLN